MSHVIHISITLLSKILLPFLKENVYKPMNGAKISTITKALANMALRSTVNNPLKQTLSALQTLLQGDFCRNFDYLARGERSFFLLPITLLPKKPIDLLLGE